MQPARSDKSLQISMFLVAWIAVLDLCTPRTNFSILYVVPLILIAQSGHLKSGWRIAGLLVLLTFGVHFIKDAIIPPSSEMPFLYRQVNRTMVVVTIVAMSQVLRMWIRWREDQEDSELPETYRRQDADISGTFALLCCAPLILLIAAGDFLTPANFNWPILYSVPLFVCAWTSNRRLLWGMLFFLLAMSTVAFIWGPPPLAPRADFALQRNRLLAALVMAVVALTLHHWMGRPKPISTA